MASAVPMITSNVGYLAELLGGSGVVLGASEKSGSYVRSIETLLANVEERTALGRRARSRFEALLLDSTKSQDDLLTDIVSGCPPGGW
jgi:glycosyltransferase involved in cell wall biosynthesis